jgi:hypothetical protein
MRTVRRLPALLALVVLAPAAPAAAQDLRYTSETDIEFGGALGAMMRFAPGGPMREVTSVKGARMRVDAGEDQSVINDVAEARFTSLDHRGKTFMSFTMDQMAAAVQQMQVQTSRESATIPVYDSATGARGNVEITVDVDDPGERKTIQGMEARRIFMTLSFDGELMVPKEEGGSGEMEDVGTIVLFNDVWLAEGFPEMRALAEAQQENAKELMQSMRSSGGGMSQVLASNPDLATAMERQADELGKLEGIAVESAMYMVGVPPDQEFDRAKALAFATQSLGSQAAGAARNAAVSEARQAASRALGGIFGRRREEPREEEQKPVEQAVVFRVRNRITGVERTSIPDSAFEVPAGYTERQLERVVR